MTVESLDDLQGLKRAARAASAALQACRNAVRAGVTTAELDAIGREVFAAHGAVSAPEIHKRFPGALCISVNDEAVHGIPGDRVLRDGDLLKLDATPEVDGYIADTAISVVVGAGNERAQALAACAERALAAAIAAAQPGVKARKLGVAVATETIRSGFRVLREVGGHGVGRAIHEAPHVPNWDDPMSRDVLHEGLVIAVEPIIAVSTDRLVDDADGWTLRTSDGSLAAHTEHTIVVLPGRSLVLTAA